MIKLAAYNRPKFTAGSYKIVAGNEPEMNQFGRFSPTFDVGLGVRSVDMDIMETGRVPSSVYTSQERFEEERALFGRVWLNIARVEEVVNPGDWVVREIHCRSTSILVVRGRDGAIRAFHNICAHRGMKLVWDSKGNSGTFTCPYHAWSFGADGVLKGIPDADCFPHVDKAQSGLRPIKLDIWEGFIFINLDPQATQTLHEFLGPLADRLNGAPFHEFNYSVRMTEMLDTNWKLAIEAQSESYHIRALHAHTVSGMVCSTDNPFCHPLTFVGLGAHRTWSTQVNPNFSLNDTKPVQSFAFRSAGNVISSATEEGGGQKCESFLNQASVNPTKSDKWGSDQIYLFPHVALNVGQNGWWMHRFWPVGPDKTYWEAAWYFRKPARLREKFAMQYSLAFNRDTLVEDSNALRNQQNVLGSGAMPFIQFGEQEVGCRHLAAVTTAAIRETA